MKRQYLKLFLFVLITILIQNAKALGIGEIIKEGNKIIAPEAHSYTWYHNGKKLDGVICREIHAMGEGLYTIEAQGLDGSLYELSLRVNTSAASPRKIFIIGDSTASYYDSTRYPRTGWAMVLQAFFSSDSVLVVNKALSGRSSKSYLTDASGWPTVLQALREGDFLFIQFGHNDSKIEDTTKYTEPYTTFKEYLTIYIDSARNRGAVPVLLTPINRNKWSGSTLTDTHGDYPPAMRQLAGEKNVPLIDMTEKTKTLFESLGVTYTIDSIFNNLPANTWLNYPDGNEDNTHLQENGAFHVCKLVMEGIAELDTNPSIGLIAPSARAAAIVQVGVNPAMIGKITGAGVFPVGQTITLKGTAVNSSTGRVVASWTHGDDTLSRAKEYSFVLDSTCPFITANFDTGYLVNVTPNITGAATISGAGRYAEGSPVTIIATTKEGYEFLFWTENSDTVGYDTAITFIMDFFERNFVANFLTLIGIDNTELSLARVYPVPADLFLNINSQSEINRIQIVDITSHYLYDQEINAKEAVINTCQFDNGIYVLIISAGSEVLQRKIQIVH